MRVLLVGKGPPDRGGIASFMLTLQERLQQRGVDVDLLNLTKSRSYVAGRLSAFNILRTLSDAWSVLRSASGYDVVHVNSSHVPAVTMIRAWMLCAAARLRGTPAVLHVHGGDLQSWLVGNLRRVITRLTLTSASGVVTASQALADVVAPLARNVTFIPNGVDVDRFRPQQATSGHPTILFAGLLSPRKGVIDLFVASKLLVDEGVAHHLVIVGGRPDEGDAVEAEVRAAAPAHARLVGSVPHQEMPQLMADADVFCLPSWYEAMPLSVLEAMASGLPVVATDVGQVAQVVTEATGSVVPPKDPTALADALRRLLVSPERRSECGAAARNRAVEEFSIDSLVDRIQTSYRSVARPALD